MNAVGNTLLQLLLEKLEDNLKFHGSYLACVDTLLIPEMLNADTKLYIGSYTKSQKLKLVSKTSSPQTNEHS